MPTSSDPGSDPAEARDVSEEWGRAQAEGETLMLRLLFLLVAISAVATMGIYARFASVSAAALPADLWLLTEEHAIPGTQVLFDASSRDVTTAELQYLPELRLEAWVGDELRLSELVQGELRGALMMPEEGTLRFRLAWPDARIGEVAATREVRPRLSDEAPEGRRRGSARPTHGLAGFHLVRRDGVCARDLRVVAEGGVPIAGLQNRVLARLTDPDGAPVEGVRLRATSPFAEVEAVDAVTDASGVARFRYRAPELAYVEFQSSCDEGEQLHGFEAIPQVQGLSVASLRVSSAGVEVRVEDQSQRLGSHYDVRCEGELLDYGRLVGAGQVSLGAPLFADQAEGARCVFQVYRYAYSPSSPHAVAPFRWGVAEDRAWSWAANATGVTFERALVGVQSSQEAVAALEAWRARGYAQVRGAWLGAYGASLALWAFMMVIGARQRRARVAPLAAELLASDDADVPAAQGSVWPILFLGWGALTLLYGALRFLLGLMGL